MIHPAASVDPQARLGSDVSIGPFTVIEGPVTIGAGSRIANNVYLCGDTVLGEGCVVYPFCSLGDTPQDFSFTPHTPSGVVIGDGCVFREGVTVHRSSREGGRTRIGDQVYLMTGCHVGHDCRIGARVTMANNTHLGGYTVIGDGATLSGNISVHQKVRVGALSMTGASSFLNADLPPYCMAIGVPAVVVGLNLVGLRRAGYGQEAIRHIKQAFRIVYRDGHTRPVACGLLEGLGTGEAKDFLRFLQGSARGILPARKRGFSGGADVDRG